MNWKYDGNSGFIYHIPWRHIRNIQCKTISCKMIHFNNSKEAVRSGDIIVITICWNNWHSHLQRYIPSVNNIANVNKTYFCFPRKKIRHDTSIVCSSKKKYGKTWNGLMQSECEEFIDYCNCKLFCKVYSTFICVISCDTLLEVSRIIQYWVEMEVE